MQVSGSILLMASCDAYGIAATSTIDKTVNNNAVSSCVDSETDHPRGALSANRSREVVRLQRGYVGKYGEPNV